MEIISQLIKNLNSLSTIFYLITSNIEPLLIKEDISNELKEMINNPEISDLVNNVMSTSSALLEKLDPIATQAKKETSNKHYPSKQIPYANFIIDEPPIVINNTDTSVQLSFDDIIKSKDIKPIKRRQPLDYTDCCPFCGAPNEYIYSNSKGKQYKCKCCESLFTIKPNYYEEITHHCPHCSTKLTLNHERNNYSVLICRNKECPFYLNNLKSLKNGEAEHLRTNTNSYKLRYTFRLFNFTFNQIKSNNSYNINSKIDINKIHHSKYTLGLILTYYVNYGLSSRKTSQILEEVHGIKISHQTIVNYAEAAAKIIEKLNETYEYDLSDTLTGDETYIKVLGKTNYVFFFSDTEKKIITSYRIFSNRDTQCAVTALYQSFNKYKVLPETMKIITDGNPIYNSAQVFFSMNDINFDLYQLIGIKNKDENSRKYRHFKQTEERLNRTYKFNYYGTNGYTTLRGANIYIVLFVCFYNFLRKHSALEQKTPIEIEELKEINLMPYKWCKLLEIA